MVKTMPIHPGTDATIGSGGVYMKIFQAFLEQIKMDESSRRGAGHDHQRLVFWEEIIEVRLVVPAFGVPFI